jgi:hypothetical protein
MERKFKVSAVGVKGKAIETKNFDNLPAALNHFKFMQEYYINYKIILEALKP